MRIYPAIDIKNGCCVRLIQGDFKQQTHYSEHPEDIGKKWEAQGASYIHVVDLDGALDGQWTNQVAIQNIVQNVNIPIQLGGGIRCYEDIQKRLNLGVQRVILGTIALQNPEFVEESIRRFGAEHIVVGIDAKEGKVATHGWENISQMDGLDFAKKMKAKGVQKIIYTDISKDGMMGGLNIEQTKRLVDETGLHVIASGGVACLEDLRQAKKIGVEGTIVGKALYQKAFELHEAIRLFERGD